MVLVFILFSCVCTMHVCAFIPAYIVYPYCHIIYCILTRVYTLCIGITMVLQSNKHTLTSIKLISNTYISNQLIYNIVDVCIYIKEITLHAMEGCTLTQAGICSI